MQIKYTTKYKRISSVKTGEIINGALLKTDAGALVDITTGETFYPTSTAKFKVQADNEILSPSELECGDFVYYCGTIYMVIVNIKHILRVYNMETEEIKDLDKSTLLTTPMMKINKENLTLCARGVR